MPQCDIFLDDPSISRRHAEIAYTDGGWVVRDLGSTNGTFLNGVRLGRIAQRVRTGDRLQPGKIILTVKEARGEVGSSVCFVEGADPPPRPQAELPDFATAPTTHLLAPIAAPRRDTPRGGVPRADVDNALDNMLTASLNGAAQAAAAQGGAVLLAEGHTRRLVLRATCSLTAGRRAKPYDDVTAKACFQNDAPAHSPGGADSGPALAVPLPGACRARGVLCLDRAVGEPPFSGRDLQAAVAVAATLAAGIETNERLLERGQNLFMQTVLTLAQAVECRDPYTAGHTQRVTDYVLLLAEAVGVSCADYHHLQIGTPLHDIGKIGIDDAILRKPGKLTEEEFAIIKSHPLKGVALLETIPELAPVLPIVRSHHEYWDGSGYPDGLAGEAISTLARLVTIADVFDALTSERPYRKALSAADAFDYLRQHAGAMFDPHFTPVFLQLRPRLEQMLQERGAFTETVSARDLDRLKDSLLSSGIRRITRPV
jgi:hypothetical protein